MGSFYSSKATCNIGAGNTTMMNQYISFEKKVVAFLIEKLEKGTNGWIQISCLRVKKKRGKVPSELPVGSSLAEETCTNIILLISFREGCEIIYRFLSPWNLSRF
jgi:hypothetical protein